MEQQEETIIINEQIFPPLIKRVQSIFVDTLTIFIAIFIISGLLSNVEGTPDWLKGALFFGLWGMYEPLCTTMGGTANTYIKMPATITYNALGKQSQTFSLYPPPENFSLATSYFLIYNSPVHLFFLFFIHPVGLKLSNGVNSKTI